MKQVILLCIGFLLIISMNVYFKWWKCGQLFPNGRAACMIWSKV